jgi:hypothetical protein
MQSDKVGAWDVSCKFAETEIPVSKFLEERLITVVSLMAYLYRRGVSRWVLVSAILVSGFVAVDARATPECKCPAPPAADCKPAGFQCLPKFRTVTFNRCGWKVVGGSRYCKLISERAAYTCPVVPYNELCDEDLPAPGLREAFECEEKRVDGQLLCVEKSGDTVLAKCMRGNPVQGQGGWKHRFDTCGQHNEEYACTFDGIANNLTGGCFYMPTKAVWNYDGTHRCEEDVKDPPASGDLRTWCAWRNEIGDSGTNSGSNSNTGSNSKDNSSRNIKH